MKNDNMVQGEESTSAHAYLYLMVDRVYVHSIASYIAGRLRGSRSSQPTKQKKLRNQLNFAPLAQLNRASGYEPEGRMFESCTGYK